MRLASPWIPRLADIDGAAHERLAAALAEDIADGHLPTGARLPPHRDLAFQLSVGLGTVTRAYGRLLKRGLVRSEHGRGMFVADRIASPGEVVDLSVNVPPAILSDGLLAATFRALADDLDGRAFSRPVPVSGSPEHRRVVARWLTERRLRVEPERVLLASGAQHALAAALPIACGAGGCLVLEALAYPGALVAARHAGLRIAPVALDHEGMRPDALDAVLTQVAQDGSRAGVCVTPTLQNPTTAVMGEARRREIARICARHDVLIVEDDAYAALGPGDLPALAELAPERALYVGGFSKVVSPGLRVGFLVPPQPLCAAAETGLQASSSMISSVACRIVTAWIADGTLDSICASMRAEARARIACATALIPDLVAPACAGGLHAWLPLGLPEAERLARDLALAGVAVTPPRVVMADPDGRQSGLRLCLGGPGKSELAGALGVLCRLRLS